jgi:hypothetical protein
VPELEVPGWRAHGDGSGKGPNLSCLTSSDYRRSGTPLGRAL